MARRWRAVDVEGLRSAVLAPDGLIPLAQADPHAARTVALAAFTQRVRRRGWDPTDVGIGIARDHDHHQPLPENGPMLGLLINAPEVALATLMEIVEIATSNWEHSELRDVEDHHIDRDFVVLLDGEPAPLTGNANVMHWHRGDPRIPNALVAALMGLEQWLYRKLDTEEPIDEFLQTLLRSRSLAIWGVLVDVACYKPDLLNGPLAPLITSAALVLADELYKVTDRSYNLLSFEEGERRRLQSWHGMGHRKIVLRDLILQKVLAEGVLRAELAAALELWAREPDDEWRFVRAKFDPANFREVELDGGRGWQFEPPQWMADAAAAHQVESQKQLFWVDAPYRLRDWINGETPPSDEQAEELWRLARDELPEMESPGDVPVGLLSRADVECGIAAALLTRARAWTFARDDVLQWCRDVVLAPLAVPPPRHEFDSSDTLSDHSWDGFAAEALAVLWAAAPDERELRAAVVRMATHRHHHSVSRLFVAVSRQQELVAELPGLEYFTLHFARFLAWLHERQHRVENAEFWPEGSPTVEELPDVEGPTNAVAEAFIAGILDETSSVAAFMEETPTGLVSPRADARHRLWLALSFEYLLAARWHTLLLPVDLDPTERQRRLEIAADLAAVLGATLVPDTDGDVDGTPYESERKLLGHLAAMVVDAGPEAARPLWQPIVAAGDGAHYWVSDLISDIWRAALAPEQVPDGFVELIKEIWAFFAEQEQTSRRGGAGDVELAMLCMSRFGYPQMEERHRPLLAALQPEWSTLVAARLASPYFAARAVRFFAEPAAAQITDDALRWLASREDSGARSDEQLDEALADLMAKLAGRRPGLLRQQDDVGGSARTVLAALVTRQNVVAMQLSAALGGR